MDEFDRIATFFAPLSDKAHGLSLTDDAAVFSAVEGEGFVVTKDVMAEGTHFLPDTNIQDLAFKLVSVNVSDLAAMGAVPFGYLLGITVPKTTKESWFEAFSSGLKQAIDYYGGVLLGGDTTTHESGEVLSLTAIGTLQGKSPIMRSGAKAGDLIVVSGTIGDAYLGLRCIKSDNDVSLSEKDRDYLLSRFSRPCARVRLGKVLHGVANSLCDVSDGLLADLEHILGASHVGAEVDLGKMPLSDAARSFFEQDAVSIENLATGGDDYELLFTVSPEKKEQIDVLSKKLDLPLTVIGTITEKKGMNVLYQGKTVVLSQKGYLHF